MVLDLEPENHIRKISQTRSNSYVGPGGSSLRVSVGFTFLLDMYEDIFEIPE